MKLRTGLTKMWPASTETKDLSEELSANKLIVGASGGKKDVKF